MNGIEIPYENYQPVNEEEACVLEYFKSSSDNLIKTKYSYSLQELLMSKTY